MSKMRQNIPKVAVITRTKNRPQLLKRAIKSVQEQSMTNFVQVVINDGGDSTEVEKILKPYQNKFPDRITFIDNKKSVGRTSALNQAIKSVNSTYIAVLDDDDSWHRDFLRETTEYLDRTGSAGVVAVIDIILEKVSGEKVTRVGVERWRPHVKEVSLYSQCIDNNAPTNAFVYQRKMYDELKGYNEELNVVEDWDFALRFILKHDIDFLVTEHALAYYHHRPEATGSIGNTVFAGVEEHHQHLNKLANYHLRKDLESGKLGVGYIMNSLRYLRQEHDRLDDDIKLRIGEAQESISKQLHETDERVQRQIIERTSVVHRIKRIKK